MKVVFFNHWHNGDIHVSRGIVKQIISKVRSLDSAITFVYSHRNSSDLLKDIEGLEYDPSYLDNVNPHESFKIIGDTVYINTWYDQQHQKYARQYGILTIDALYAALDETCIKLWGFSLQEANSNPIEFFPSIDYSKYQIHTVKQWLINHPEPKILIESGEALSNQAHNFAMVPIVIELAKQHPNKTFIISHKQNVILPSNVFFTQDIIQKVGTDLNEISFLSTHCDLIVGRSSGVFTFSVVKENLFERNIKLISFSHLMSGQNKFWLGKLLQDKINYSSIIFATNESNTNKVLEVINRNL